MSGAFLWASAPRRQWLHHVIAADLLAAHSCSTPSQKVLLLDSHLVTVEVTELQIYQTTGYVSQSPTVRSWWVCVHRSLIFLFLADRSGRCSWFASRFDMFVLRSFPPPSSVLKSGCLSHPSFSPYLQHSLTVLSSDLAHPEGVFPLTEQLLTGCLFFSAPSWVKTVKSVVWGSSRPVSARFRISIINWTAAP